MDWIKVLTRHALVEYTDLKDSEFVAWIKIMALTAELEHEPSREQMLKYVHYKTLDSLQCKLNKHSIDLQYVLNKVSMDVQYVVNNRERSKVNTKRYRDKLKPVSDNVMLTSAYREEKRREEKNIKAGEAIHLPVDNSKKDDQESPPFPETEKPKEAPLKKEEPKPKYTNTHGERWTDELGKEFEQLMTDIKGKAKPYLYQQVFKFTQTYYNKANPKAINRCLGSFHNEIIKGRVIALPYEWLEAALMGSDKTGKAGENGKCEAEESEKENQRFKQQDREGFEIIGSILSRARA